MTDIAPRYGAHLGHRNITLLDGGMGQELRKRSQLAPTQIWSAQTLMDEIDLVVDVHADFLRAGAEILTLNSYAVTRPRLARVGQGDAFDRLQERAGWAARQAVMTTGHTARIAGCLPPLVASYHSEVALDFDTSLAQYEEIVAAQTVYADLFIAETMANSREAIAACQAAASTGKPVWVGFTVKDDDGTQLRSGERLGDAARAVLNAGADAVLINCSSPEAVGAGIANLAGLGVPVGGYANGFANTLSLKPGGTVDVLEARQDLDPDAYAAFAADWIAAGAEIIGGCCEVGPTHIARLRELIASVVKPEGETDLETM
ncbi:MAG: homocysteine S-methyltransferase family protein [Pseudomonadota bacterium]